MNKDLKKVIIDELTYIPDFINPKIKSQKEGYDLIHNIDSATFYAINKCCEYDTFLDDVFLEEMAFELSVEINEMCTDTNFMFQYLGHVLTFFQYLEQYSAELELYETSYNLKKLREYISGEKTNNRID